MTGKKKGGPVSAGTTPNQTSHAPDLKDVAPPLQATRPLIEASQASQRKGGRGYGRALELAESDQLPGVFKDGGFWRIRHGSFELVVKRLLVDGGADA